jgi:hypothetical protein
MTAQRARWGPWTGGLNLRDAVVAEAGIPANQLRALENLDVLDSGVLYPRRGIRRSGGPTMYTEIGGSGSFSLLGAVDAGNIRSVVVGAWNGSSPGATFFHYSSLPTSRLDADWPLVATTTSEPGRYCAVVQYNGVIYFVPDTTNAAVGGFSRTSLSSGGFTAVSAMPRGDEAFMVRERLFVVDWASSTLFWSKATDPTVWAVPDGGSLQVNPNDGQPISATVVVNSQVYIFKKNRTYLLTFNTDPGVDGQVTLINDQLGALDAIAESNGVLAVNDRGVYRVLNNYFSQLDQLVNLGANFALPFADPAGVWLSLEGGDNLVVGPSQLAGSTYSHAAMNLHTGAWSGRTYSEASNTPSTRYLVGRNASQQTNLYGHKTRNLSAVPFTSNRKADTLDLSTSLDVTSPRYVAATGEFDADDPTSFKRMAWVFARLKNALPAGDSSVQLRTYQAESGDFDLATVAQTANVPAGTWGGKITGLSQYRFTATALELRKNVTTLTPGITDPNTASEFWIRSLHAVADDQGGSVRS